MPNILTCLGHTEWRGIVLSHIKKIFSVADVFNKTSILFCFLLKIIIIKKERNKNVKLVRYLTLFSWNIDQICVEKQVHVMCNIHGFHFDCVCVVGVRGGVSTALHPPLHSILLSPAQAVLKLHTTHKQYC